MMDMICIERKWNLLIQIEILNIVFLIWNYHLFIRKLTVKTSPFA